MRRTLGGVSQPQLAEKKTLEKENKRLKRMSRRNGRPHGALGPSPIGDGECRA